MILRLAWICGLVSTRDYDSRMRQRKIGIAAIAANDGALERMERSLVEDRIAVIVFLVAITIFLYTLEYAPAFRA
ncbi:MAG TPA: hypothetical protein VNX70_20670 [Bryobacteraceae bacterium]|nr:hypothetical protein [Bryobacteraceae bacterium]